MAKRGRAPPPKKGEKGPGSTPALIRPEWREEREKRDCRHTQRRHRHRQKTSGVRAARLCLVGSCPVLPCGGRLLRSWPVAPWPRGPVGLPQKEDPLFAVSLGATALHAPRPRAKGLSDERERGASALAAKQHESRAYRRLEIWAKWRRASTSSRASTSRGQVLRASATGRCDELRKAAFRQEHEHAQLCSL